MMAPHEIRRQEEANQRRPFKDYGVHFSSRDPHYMLKQRTIDVGSEWTIDLPQTTKRTKFTCPACQATEMEDPRLSVSGKS